MRGKRSTVLLLGLALLLGVIVTACRDTRPTATPVPTWTPGPTWTPESTWTPEPTWTPPPTLTRMPTREPTWTPTTTPEPTRTPQRKPTQTPAPVPTVTDVSDCGRYAGQGREFARGHRRQYGDLVYVKDQIILTGDRDEIDKLRQGLSQRLPRLSLALVSEFETIGGTAIQLYNLSEPESVELTTCVINALSRELELSVSSDPNYHLSPAQWAGADSPWTQNGEWPRGLNGGGLAEAASKRFLEQKALGADGIHLLDDSLQQTVRDYPGEGVRIGIFDTSPFTDKKNNLAIPDFVDEREIERFDVRVSVTETLAVTQFPVPFSKLAAGADDEFMSTLAWNDTELTVWHLEVEEAENCPGGLLECQDLSNHGLFVAGLAHAVAPASEIHLIRVLQNDGCGSLYSIGRGIEMWVDQMLTEDPDQGIVVNLSLGVHEPPNPTIDGLPPEVTSLQRIVADVMERRAVVVAAAGNDSYEGTIHEAEIPARDPDVIGVAASNLEGKRACYSNEGSIAAPGGEGVAGNDSDCQVPVDECRQDSGSDSHCLVSLVYKPEPGFAYWLGTSFATPLVSGLAARTMEKESVEIRAQVADGACPSPDSPWPLGDGIINLPHALAGQACP